MVIKLLILIICRFFDPNPEIFSRNLVTSNKIREKMQLVLINIANKQILYSIISIYNFCELVFGF